VQPKAVDLATHICLVNEQHKLLCPLYDFEGAEQRWLLRLAAHCTHHLTSSLK